MQTEAPAKPICLWKRIHVAYQRLKQAVAPGSRAWRGATLGALTALTIVLLAAAFGMFGQAPPAHFLAGTGFFLASFALIGALLAWVWRLLRVIPLSYIWVVACAVPALVLMALTAMSVSVGILLTGFGILAVASLLGAGWNSLAGRSRFTASRLQHFIALGGILCGFVGVIAGGAWLLDDGLSLAKPLNAVGLSADRVKPLTALDPSQPGTFAVRTMFYGSGNDRHREEYGAKVDLLTQPVDGSSLVDGWSDLRTAYWGFGSDSLPINGRVWYPVGKGPFPLVLMVHGQHPMEDFSDDGYAYLGELLASRGFIVASVDENFLNLSPLVDLFIFQGLKGENDLRGWLLLEHLQVWRAWNDSPDSIFYRQINLDQIALIGHSRGGEAAAVAVAFNRLSYNPDNARLRFSYHFAIRSVVGIAPVDGTLQPAGQAIDLDNINYLVLHGAHDMDVFTFQGNRQYARVNFTDEGDWFKSAVYIYGANHGQFNTRWGRKDLFEPVMRIFNLQQLMPAEDQQQFARATISAFLEATLNGKTAYRAFFQDLRRGKDWLPHTLYLHQYQDSNTQLISTYEEDIDLVSTTLPEGSLTGENLTLWREQPAQAKWNNFGNQTAYLGWDAERIPETASYTIRIPQRGLMLNDKSTFVFSMADARLNLSEEMRAEAAFDHRTPIDLTVEVVDGSGNAACLPLSHFSLLQPPLEGNLGKARWMSPFPTSEVVLQHFEFALDDFVSVNPAFCPAELSQVRFIFNRTKKGVVVLDNIGFRTGR